MNGCFLFIRVLAAAAWLAASGFAAAQEPVSAASSAAPAPADWEDKELLRLQERLVTFEVFSLPPQKARKALIKHPDGAALYAWIEAELGKEEPDAVMENTHLLRLRNQGRSKTESLDEYSVATELIPPQISQTATTVSAGPLPVQPAGPGRIFGPWPSSRTTPNSLEWRNTGWTSEAAMQITDDGRQADLKLALEMVRLAAVVPQGLLGDIFQPVFETRKVTAQVLATVGQPALVSTFSPPGDTGTPGNDNEDRVWLLFVTVTIPE